MKINQYLILSLFFAFSFSYAQSISVGKDGTFTNNWHEGKLVLKNKDTLVGLVKFDDVSDDLIGFSLSHKIKFKANADAKKQKFKKKKVDYFIITNNSKETFKYTYIKIPIKGLILVKVVTEGRVNIYSDNYAYTSHGDLPAYRSGTLIYAIKDGKKKANPLFQSTLSSSFQRRAAKYFSDCPSLIEKIENKTYRPKDFKLIADEYNSCQ